MEVLICGAAEATAAWDNAANGDVFSVDSDLWLVFASVHGQSVTVIAVAPVAV